MLIYLLLEFLLLVVKRALLVVAFLCLDFEGALVVIGVFVACRRRDISCFRVFYRLLSEGPQ